MLVVVVVVAAADSLALVCGFSFWTHPLLLVVVVGVGVCRLSFPISFSVPVAELFLCLDLSAKDVVVVLMYADFQKPGLIFLDYSEIVRLASGLVQEGLRRASDSG